VADLTTVDGLQFSFDPAAVSAVTDRDPDTGAADTCVYGITAGFVKIRETVNGFLGRLGIAGKFAKLTKPNGAPVWINAPAVTSVRAASTSLGDPPKANSVVSVGSLTQRLTQDLVTAKAAINALRAPGAQL
jgi:hypothetical protein